MKVGYVEVVVTNVLIDSLLFFTAYCCKYLIHLKDDFHYIPFFNKFNNTYAYEKIVSL